MLEIFCRMAQYGWDDACLPAESSLDENWVYHDDANDTICRRGEQYCWRHILIVKRRSVLCPTTATLDAAESSEGPGLARDLGGDHFIIVTWWDYWPWTIYGSGWWAVIFMFRWRCAVMVMIESNRVESWDLRVELSGWMMDGADDRPSVARQTSSFPRGGKIAATRWPTGNIDFGEPKWREEQFGEN